jgi:CRP-like cAMP-binding protein
MAATDISELLGTVEPFNRMSPEQRSVIGSQFERCEIAAGQTLVEQGAVADAMYVVLSGRLGVFSADDPSAPKYLASLDPGDIVGEVALLAGGRRSATVRAVSDSSLGRLGSVGFNRLLQDDVELAGQIAALSARRLRETQLSAQLRALFDGLSYPKGESVPIVVVLFYKDLPQQTYQQWRRNQLPHDEFARWVLAEPRAIPLLSTLLNETQ